MSGRRETAFLQALGDAVRQARKRRGLSQEQLGFESGLDRTYISGVERGVRNPTVQSLRRLADALDTRPSRLLRRAEDALESRG